MSDAASVRILNLDGTATDLGSDTDATKPYGLARPAVLADPNPIASVVAVAAEGKDPRLSPFFVALTAHAAWIDGLSDVASVLMQPLVEPKDAAPGALLFSAQYAREDVAFSDQVRRINEKELFGRAFRPLDHEHPAGSQFIQR